MYLALDRRRVPASLSLVFALVLALTGCKKQEKPTTASPEVEVVEVAQKDVPIYSEWVGSTDGFINAQIQPRVSGYLLAQRYKEGSFLKKGELLFQIDARPFQAALDQAKGQLAQAQAALGKTELDVKRYTPLAKESVVSQEELDNAIQANLGNKAAVAAATAAMEQAQLNLDFTRIFAPIEGIAGIAQAQIGDLVGPNSVLTTISTVNPIKVYFPFSEQEYLKYTKDYSSDKQRIEGAKDLRLELSLADGTTFPYPGRVSFADRQVDPRTGTLRVAAVFPNPGNVLRPGQFARVRAVMETKKGALLVVQRAVTELQGSYQVAVVGGDNRVAIRSVKVGPRIGSLWIIEEGLRPGERVIAEGIQKVRQGVTVTPKPYKAAGDSRSAPGPNVGAK